MQADMEGQGTTVKRDNYTLRQGVYAGGHEGQGWTTKKDKYMLR